MIDRRRILTKIVQLFSVVGIFFTGYPFIKSSSIFKNRQHELEIDLTDLSFNEIKKVSWLGRPVIIVRRSKSEITAINARKTLLKDPLSDFSVQPSFAKNNNRSIREDIFVVFGNCTHLGCIVKTRLTPSESRFNCPCHDSKFDGSGRVFSNAVAPRNLEVPNYVFISKNTLLLTAST